MSVTFLCHDCTPGSALARLNLNEPDSPLRHCYGRNDRPGTPGLIGSGVYCSCDCKRQPHQPHELYAVAAKEHPGDLPAIRDRYRDLMVEHGHLIPGKPEPLPCGWPSTPVPTEDTEHGK